MPYMEMDMNRFFRTLDGYCGIRISDYETPDIGELSKQGILIHPKFLFRVAAGRRLLQKAAESHGPTLSQYRIGTSERHQDYMPTK